MRLLFVVFFFFQILQSNAQVLDTHIRFTHLTGDFYIYTTYNLYKGEKIPANGMYLVSDEGVVLFDTPWDTSQFQPLLDSIQFHHNKDVIICLATHFHDDRSAGLEYYRSKAIKTYTTLLTDELSKKNNKKRAEFLLTKDTVFHIGQYSFETYYPGPGHTQDNIVIWFKKEKILYGGCLIKSAEDEDLGNLGDADKKEFAHTIHRLQRKCRRPEYIIVGHGDWTNLRSLQHTYEMAKELGEKIPE